MEKSLILAALAAVFVGHSVSAQVVVPAGQRPLGYCAIQARLTMNSGALGIAVLQGQGFGRVVCKYRDGSDEIMPILVETSAVGVGIQLPETMSGKLFAPGFGVTDAGAVGLLGTYGVIRATGGIGYANGEIGLGLTINETGVSIPAIMQLDTGFHFLTATLNFGQMTIRFDPQNLQARYVHLLPVQSPRRPHRHSHSAVQHQPDHHRQRSGGKAAPLPPKRPTNLGKEDAQKPSQPSQDQQQNPTATAPRAAPPAPLKPVAPATPPAAPAQPAPSKPASAAPAPALDGDAEPVSREI